MNRIMGIHKLGMLALQKRSVHAPGTWLREPKPAAVVMNFQGHLILRLIDQGLYVYEAKNKKDKPFNFRNKEDESK
ncbi:MAG TPA: hypothetical protein DCZ95_18080 [Verrucomicrobia bacterium]|nr:hypothetical protein [Verrucomicrobiota bacterium]